MLDIIPIKDNGLTSCVDAQLEAYGIWKKIGYELMYIDNWNFVFREEGYKGPGIWSRGKLAPRLFFDDLLDTRALFEKYHGVSLNFMELDSANLRDKLDKFLVELRMPVLVFFDTYYLPWLEKFYKKIHSKHTIMAIGKEGEGYLFNDTRPFLLEPIHGGYLDWEHIREGFGNGINYFYEKKVDINYEDIRNQLVSVNFEMFEAMRRFGLYIEEINIDKEDIEDFDGGNGILIRAFRNIIRTRLHYQQTLKYVNNKYSYLEIEVVIDAFQDIIERWSMTKNLLYKAYLLNDYSKFNHKLSKRILDCAEFEERTAQLLIKLLKFR